MVVFDPRTRALVDEESFSGLEEAEAALRVYERRHLGTALQVTMFTAESLDDVKLTHPHFFRDRPSTNGETFEFVVPA